MASSEDGSDVAIQVESTQTLILEKPPCCLEFSPLFPDYFVVGTYNLVREEDHEDERAAEAGTGESEDVVKARKQTRDGSLILCRLGPDGM